MINIKYVLPCFFTMGCHFLFLLYYMFFNCHSHCCSNLPTSPLPLICFGSQWMQDELYRAKLKKSNERSLALIKSGMDTVVAVGLLQLAPKKVTPRVTGAFGFASSLISCYQVLTIFFHQSLYPLFIYLTLASGIYIYIYINWKDRKINNLTMSSVWGGEGMILVLAFTESNKLLWKL